MMLACFALVTLQKKDTIPTTQKTRKLVGIELYRLISDYFGIVGLEWSEFHFSRKTVGISG